MTGNRHSIHRLATGCNPKLALKLALLCVALPLLFPDVYAQSMTAAGLLWMAAFGLFVWVYAPMLLRPRVDGKPG